MSYKYNFERLSAHILWLSESDDFNVAKLEWVLDGVCVTQEFGRCPCGVRIKAHCCLLNRRNGNTTWVCNVCVHKFMDINADALFGALNSVWHDNSAIPNMELIEYAWRRGNLYGPHEYAFLMNIHRRYILSERQLHWLQKINRRIVENIVVRYIPFYH